MPDSIKTDEVLWASCIGGVMQIDDHLAAIETPGCELTADRAKRACQESGVERVSLGATR